MAQAAQSNQASQTRPSTGAKLDHIITCATRVFSEKGYEGASIRDISRLSGVSLAGLYYYFESKEELLYLIQRHYFTLLTERATGSDARLTDSAKDAAPAAPEDRLRALIHSHMSYFLQNPEAMKVLSHESETLTGDYAEEVAALKRTYYHLCRGIIDELKRERKLKGLNTRVAVMSLFGMMNWIYTWHNGEVDPGADAIADQMYALFLGGLLDGTTLRGKGKV